MKLILLQITRNVLSLTGVTSGRRAAFGLPQTFELPESMRRGQAYNDIPLLAKFVRECIAAAQMGTKNIIFCLEDDNVICKEYQHLPCKTKNLLSFARLEAESVLSDSVDDYLIENYEYNHANEVTGKLTSALFAAKSRLILGIKRSFGQYGLHVLKIVPPIGGLLYAANQAVNSKGQTVAMLDLGFEKTRLLVLHDGFPVFQRTFESIYEDIIDLIRKEKSVSYREAAGLINSWGVYGEATPDANSTAAKQVAMLLDASANEAVRNIRMVLSSERLELNRIILCGAMSTLPNFSEFWNQLGLDVPLESIDLNAATGNLPEVTPEARSAGLRSASFFAASGLLVKNNIDFLNTVKAKSGAQAANIAVLAVITLLAVGVMSLEPLIYTVKIVQSKADKQALASAESTGIKELLQTQNDLTNQIGNAKADRDKLPFDKSKTEDMVKQLAAQVAAKAKSVGSAAIDNTTGDITLTFVTANYNDYLSIKHDIETNGYFTIKIPFTIAFQTDGACSCSVVLHVSNFTPWNTGSKGGGQSEKP